MTSFSSNKPSLHISNTNNFIDNNLVYSKQGVKELLQLALMSPKKSLGQNYLFDKNVLQKITKFALNREKVSTNADEHQTIVVEIGSGLGALTWTLLQQGVRVIAIEIQKDSVQFSQRFFADVVCSNEDDFLSSNKRLLVVHADFLQCSLNRLLAPFKQQDVFLVGNLPYHSASAILFKTFADKHFFKRITFLLQQEVAERIIAKPANKEYGILSVVSRYHLQFESTFSVSSYCFYPQPKVESSVVCFSPLLAEKESKYSCKDENFFHQLVRSAFNQRRKQVLKSILNSPLIEVDEYKLRQTFSEIEQLYPQLAKIHPISQLRAEDLSVEHYLSLTNIYCSI